MIPTPLAQPDPTPPTPPSPSTAAGGGGGAWRRRIAKAVIVPMLLIGALLLVVGLLLALLVSTSWGTQAVASLGQPLVASLHLEHAEGALLGQGQIQQIRWAINPTQTLVIDHVDWHLDRISVAPWPVLHFDHVRVQSVTLHHPTQTSPPPPASPLMPPSTLVLPIGLEIENVTLETLSLSALGDEPVQHLKARLSLAAGPLGLHHIDRVEGAWSHLRWQGHGQIASTAPFKLNVEATIETTATAPIAWQAQAIAKGGLETMTVQVDLHGWTQTLQGTATVQPFAPWPLPQLNLHTDQLNLAALHPHAPQTLLSGDVQTQWQAASMRWQVQADLRNAKPDRLDRHGLPVSRLQCHMTAQHNHGITSGDVQNFVAELHREPNTAGPAKIEGHGQWVLDEHHQPERLSLQVDTHIAQLHPADIDRHGPAFEITGPLAVEAQLPWPLTSTAWLKGASDLFMSVKADLRGQQLAPHDVPAVQLQLNGRITPQRLHIEQLHAQAGTAILHAQGQWEHQVSSAQHHVGVDATLEHFDPRIWWPGDAAEQPWRAPPTRLDGTITADLRQSTAAFDRLDRLDASPALMSTLQGHALVQLRDSLLAGLALTGTLRLQTQEGATPQNEHAAPWPLSVDTSWQLGAKQNSTDISVRGTWHTDPTNDQWHVKLHSPALQRLQPWLNLVGSSADIAGDLDMDVDIQGRWPDAYASGHAQAQDLQMDPNHRDHKPGLHLQKFKTRFDAGSHPRDQLDIQASLGEASWPGLHLGSTELTVQGSANRHRLQLQSLAQFSDPTTGELNSMLPTPLRMELLADGRWQHRPSPNIHPETAKSDSGSDHWEGEIQALHLKDAKAPASAPDFLQLDPTSLSYHRDERSQTFRIQPTRLQWLALHLVLDECLFQTQADSTTPHLIFRSRLEPLEIAPLLARAQPGFGWEGDLKMGGHANLSLDPRNLSADIALERLAGDLQVNDPDNPLGPQPLGLAELRLALQGHQGHWQLQQHVAGGHLGSLEGQQNLQTRSTQSPWPTKEDVIDGSLDVRIAELGRWGRWLPPGWLLSGKLETQARIQGQLGNPNLRGDMHGTKIGIQNALNGIDWHDAELKATLTGNTAHIETLTMKAGEGHVQASGDLVLNASHPHAHMTATAQRFALLQRVDRRVVVSGTTQIEIDQQRTSIQGALRADEGHIDFSQGDAPGLSDDVLVSTAHGLPRQTKRTEDAPPRSPTASARNTVVDMKLDMGDAFTVQGRGLHTALVGSLALSNPRGKLAIHGTIHTGDDGTYSAYGQKLAIDRGRMTFTGPPSNPQLDIEATRPDIDEVRVGVAVTGTVENMRVRLFSDPALNDTDKLSWLILGRAPDGLGRTDLALLQRAAYALISGEGDSPSLLERVGLDQVSVRKSDGDAAETVVSLGKQLSRRWYVGYERSLNAASGTWQLIYRIAQRFTLRAQSGSDRAIDLIWIWRWRPPEPVIEPTPAAPEITKNGPQGV
ncbi:MAG: translocation/assembly module TamB domain-containing protein [Leptothrix ochracea]|uniref:translocation/assembly module TamB domain-containing protein n=1 Tax=Leptothrix ochracea TaxID=735331 RepID=UPI0034E2AFF1